MHLAAISHIMAITALLLLSPSTSGLLHTIWWYIYAQSPNEAEYWVVLVAGSGLSHSRIIHAMVLTYCSSSVVVDGLSTEWTKAAHDTTGCLRMDMHAPQPSQVAWPMHLFFSLSAISNSAMQSSPYKAIPNDRLSLIENGAEKLLSCLNISSRFDYKWPVVKASR